MNPVQEEVPKPGGVRSGSTLLEEMKILEEIQGQTGMKKILNSELWHACAGPLVSLPQIGSLVYYFPQGHSEQVAISTRRPTNTHIPNYPILPSQLLCQVLNITLHADRDTDEIYAQVTLQPINSEKDILPASNFRHKQSKHPSEFFCKTLTASDTSTHGGFSVPRRAAEKLFPTLDYAMQPPTQELVVRDLHDNSWTFRHIYRGQPRRHLLTTGWSLFVGGKRLRAGDSVLFIRDEKSQLLLGVRCSNRQQTAFSSSVLSADSMHMGVLAAAAHAAANRSPFTVFYNPRACPSEFIVPLAKYHKSVYGTQVSAGMRFGMMFETEESSKRRFMGTVVGISDLDPIRWPNSKWRSVQVEWDELGNGERPSKVCLWEIETPEWPFICPTPVSNLKRTLPPAFSDYGWDNVLKRSLGRFSGRGNTGLQYPLLQNLGSDFMKVLANQPLSLPPDPPIELMEASILQTLRSTELNRTLPSPLSSLPVQDLGIPALSQQTNQHSLLEDLLSQDQNSQNYQHFLPFCGSSVVSHLGIQTQENVIDELPLEQKKEDLPNKHDEKPDIVHKDPTASHSPSILSVLVQKGTNCNTMPLESTEEKCICSPLNRQNLLSQMYPDQDLSLLSLSLETNNLNTLLSFTGHQFPPYGDTSDWMLQPNSSQSLNSMFMSPESLSATNKPAPFLLSPSVDASSILDAPSLVSLEVTNTKESHHILSTSTSTGSQEFGCLQQLTCPRFPSEFKDFSEDSINQSEGYSSLQFEADTSVSQSGLEAFYTVKGTKGQKHSECPSGLYTASQDVQSQITSRSLSNSQPFSVQDFPDDNSGGTSSSHGEGDGHFMQQGMLQQVSPPFRTYTKVQKLGSVGRSIDATRFSNYNELKSAIACMFGIQGQLDDPRGSAWKLVYVDYENDVLLVGDDPWEEFVRCVRCIRILSPSEVQKMSEEGMQILNGTINQGEEFVA